MDLHVQIVYIAVGCKAKLLSLSCYLSLTVIVMIHAGMIKFLEVLQTIRTLNASLSPVLSLVISCTLCQRVDNHHPTKTGEPVTLVKIF